LNSSEVTAFNSAGKFSKMSWKFLELSLETIVTYGIGERQLGEIR
jgi:hypothetical protein